MVYEVFDQGHQRFTHFCDGFFSVASGLILKGEALKGIMSQYIWVDTDGKGTVTGFCGNGFCKVTVGNCWSLPQWRRKKCSLDQCRTLPYPVPEDHMGIYCGTKLL